VHSTASTYTILIIIIILIQKRIHFNTATANRTTSFIPASIILTEMIIASTAFTAIIYTLATITAAIIKEALFAVTTCAISFTIIRMCTQDTKATSNCVYGPKGYF